MIADYGWSVRGPSNVGGRTRALARDVDNPDLLLAGGVTGGMWRSSDGGNLWSRTTTPEQLPSVTCIVQDTRPGHHNVWYYGTGELRTNSTRFGGALYSGDGIFKSIDGGKSWTQLPATVSNTPQLLDQPFDYVWKIVIDQSNSNTDVLLAATYGGIMRSTDGGASRARRSVGRRTGQALLMS